MANPLSKGWKYLMASFDQKIDENADPKVQIQQAVAAAKKQHQEITEQAAAVIGNEKKLQMQLHRLQTSQADLQAKARTALQMADKATAEGDSAAATSYTQTAEAIAAQLVSVETELQNTVQMHDQAAQAAAQAQEQQRQSEARLNAQLAEVDKLLAQADQAAMQEKTVAAMDSIQLAGGSGDSVPTLDGVREKIERRYARALGAQELAESGSGGAMAEIAATERNVAASSKLEEIRAQMRAESAGSLEAPAAEDSPAELESGDAEAGAGAGDSDAAEDETAGENDAK